jgi:3-methylcrotonyl-CoA carboxylase alpha subunit
MFKKILIANRGEIACRVAATARRLGVRTVAVYSDADAHARHVQACDEAVHIGGNSPRDSYLRGSASSTPPGHRRAGRAPRLRLPVRERGLRPGLRGGRRGVHRPAAGGHRRHGQQGAAKSLMEKAGVPLVPGYHGTTTTRLLAREAARIGYPVLIKASAGGGGKGMRRVDKAEDFAAALASRASARPRPASATTMCWWSAM